MFSISLAAVALAMAMQAPAGADTYQANTTVCRPFPNSPIRYTDTPAGIYRRAPRLGEHTEEILEELGVEP